ncbi:MAG: magnesium/cobalt transporter CorA [Deltaproteobacteria bacterium]|nr:magnesium/cobalt transporter CorA [Deltaproteobacteria bacterium]
MDILFKRASEKAGLPPGTIVHVGEKKSETVEISLIDYDATSHREMDVKNIEDVLPFKETPAVTWVNIDGLHDVDIIEKVGGYFNIHPLVLEDIVHTGQRPKFEELEEYIFVILRMFYFGTDGESIESEQVSVILGPNYVISFQERTGDIFNALRERLRNGRGRIRRMGADYLAYSLMDSIVDNYFVILERYGEQVELIEEELAKQPDTGTMATIHRLKKEVVMLRKSIWPLREIVSGLERSESELVKESMSIFLRDLYDHTIQVIDAVEAYQDVLSGLLDLYLSSISNRMNEVMKVLTIFATIFIPLTFIAGIYGMNFEYMPELKWHWAYPVFWIVIIAVSAVMLIFFRRRKWF